MNDLPPKTIERLSQYRRALLVNFPKEKKHVFSHELANLLHLNPVQVRRDLMLIGYSGSHRKGYDIKKLIGLIGQIIDTKHGRNVAILGIGNLGQAIMSYFNGKRSKLAIVAAFDVDPKKIGTEIAGVRCYHINDLQQIIEEKKISIGIITVPPEFAKDIATKLVASGIKGLMNYTTSALNVPEDVFLEEYDMITSLEKVAFFAKQFEE